jgi:hypothetical protein
MTGAAQQPLPECVQYVQALGPTIVAVVVFRGAFDKWDQPPSTGTRARRRLGSGRGQARGGRARGGRRSAEDRCHLERSTSRRAGRALTRDRSAGRTPACDLYSQRQILISFNVEDVNLCRRQNTPKTREEIAVIHKTLAVIFAIAFVTATASPSLAYVGANAIPKLSGVPASKNKKVTNHGVGANTMPSYASTPASKNKKVTNHGVGANTMPSYPATNKKP